MCGIVGYIGWREAVPLLLKGLKRLEYRGYDSAGVALLNDGLLVMKQKGSVSGLEVATEGLSKEMKAATVGIGHTRWATHGEPSDINAHPHQNSVGDIAVIHNGIIENYSALKQELAKRPENLCEPLYDFEGFVTGSCFSVSCFAPLCCRSCGSYPGNASKVISFRYS